MASASRGKSRPKVKVQSMVDGPLGLAIKEEANSRGLSVSHFVREILEQATSTTQTGSEPKRVRKRRPAPAFLATGVNTGEGQA